MPALAKPTPPRRRWPAVSASRARVLPDGVPLGVEPEADLEPNAESFARLLTYTDRAVAAVVDSYEPGRPIITYADDDALRKAALNLWPSLPASWHRAVAWRAAQQIPGATIDRRTEN